MKTLPDAGEVSVRNQGVFFVLLDIRERRLTVWSVPFCFREDLLLFVCAGGLQGL